MLRLYPRRQPFVHDRPREQIEGRIEGILQCNVTVKDTRVYFYLEDTSLSQPESMFLNSTPLELTLLLLFL